MYNKKNVIKSVKHQLYTMIINKISLSPFDDKRWIHADKITTLVIIKLGKSKLAP